MAQNYLQFVFRSQHYMYMQKLVTIGKQQKQGMGKKSVSPLTFNTKVPKKNEKKHT